MPTIKEAKIKIESRIENLDGAGLPEGDVERAEVATTGFYYFADGQVKLTYAEENEGGRVESEIFWSDGALVVRRSGAIKSEMIFKPGESHDSLYSVAAYSFDVTVKPRRMQVELLSDGGRIDLLYNMSIGGADKAVRMKIWIQTN